MKKPSLFTKVAAGAVALGVGVAVLPGAIATDEYIHDGLSSHTAAASCWEVKQNNPDAASGAYWLQTPRMDAPQQFYCDQETDGGGWVLIGRGREGWTEEYAGRGNAAELFNNPDGTDAFVPVQLSGSTIDALTNGESPKDYADGIRIRRAADVHGSIWQEIRAKHAQNQQWTWAMRASTRWSSVSFENPRVIGDNFASRNALGNVAAGNNAYNSLTFTTSSVYNWNNGFTYGTQVRGNSNTSSYLWTPNGSAPMPFAQMYLRPKLTQRDLGYNQIADEGVASSQRRQLPNNYSATMVWRTSTESGTGIVDELNTRVQAITQVGDTVFTGGDFKNVVSAQGETVDQSFLAGYNVHSAELVRSFRPTFNGQIKALEGLSNGKLAVGGEFTRVNGQEVAGFVVLDPVTGQIDTTYNWSIENRVSGVPTVVKSIQESNGYLYIAGSFTHTKGHTRNAPVYARNAARFNMADGGVDVEWRPVFNGTVNGISAAEDGSAVYTAGYFTANHGEKSHKLAHLTSTDGRNKTPWDWQLSYTTVRNASNQGFQFDVQAAAESVWAGGAEHLIAQYDKTNMARLYSAITRVGGDFQDLYRDANSDVIYGACHCGDWIYENTGDYAAPATAATNVHRIRLVAAWDAKTGQVLPEFGPEMSGAQGHGVWESFMDSTGTLWVGGDITKSRGANGAQNTIGFARYTPRDTVAPAVPQNLAVTSDGTTDNLTWSAVGEGRASYQVLRNDRVIATVTGTSFSLPHIDDARYFVRAVDAAGNYSASSPVALATVVRPVPEPEPTSLAPTEPLPAPEPTEATPQPLDEATNDPSAPAVDENPNPIEPVEPVAPEKPADQQVFASGDQWEAAFHMNNPWDTTWKDPDYRYDTARHWYQTTTSVGWGEWRVNRRISFGYNAQPMSMLLRKEIDIAPQPGHNLVLTTYADDGIAVYVNGKEVHRENLAAGAYPDTPALSRVAYSDARRKPITISIPASELNQGKNLIAVEVHSFRRYEPATFDMEALLTAG